MDYPFVPKSAVKLEHGHFWGIELISGAWAAGVVIQPMREARPGNRTAIIAGLLDWKGPEPPTDSDLADVTSYVMITVIHFKAITWHGGQVLGQLDNVPPDHPDLVDFPSGRVLSQGHFLDPGVEIDRRALDFLSATNLKGFWGRTQSSIGKTPSSEIHARHDEMTADQNPAS